MADLSGRLMDRIQLTTDGLAAYIDAVLENFGDFVDYHQLVKIFGDDPLFSEQCGAKIQPVENQMLRNSLDLRQAAHQPSCHITR